MLKGVDLALTAAGDPERAIALAREWILVGPPDGMSETVFKQLIASGKGGS
jgi:hypothetical protein